MPQKVILMTMSCEGRLAFCLGWRQHHAEWCFVRIFPLATALTAEIDGELGRGSETNLRRAHDYRGVRGRTTRYATSTVIFR